MAVWNTQVMVGQRSPGCPCLQGLKGWGLSLRRFGFEAEAGLAEEPVDECGPVLDAPEPAADGSCQFIDGAGGEVAQAVLQVCPEALSWFAMVHGSLRKRM